MDSHKIQESYRILPIHSMGQYGGQRLLMIWQVTIPQDHKDLFEICGKIPDVTRIPGDWEGRIISNSSLTPPLFRLSYQTDNVGKVTCKWNFMNIFIGNSKIELTSEQLKMFDFTNFHDEIRMISDDVMIGKYILKSNQVINIIGDNSLGLVQFEKSKGETIPNIYYYLNKVPKL